MKQFDENITYLPKSTGNDATQDVMNLINNTVEMTKEAPTPCHKQGQQQQH